MPAPFASTLRRTWISLIVIATLAYYFWTVAVVSGGPPRIKGVERDHYNLLSHGFLAGHLHLAHEPEPELLNSPNPYDPAFRKPGVELLFDASYYRGKYYIYFGPAPVITLLLPFRALTGRDLPLTYAVWVYACAAYLALVGIFVFLRRRHFPQSRLLPVTIALVGLGGASMLTALLRRPHMWELAIACGLAFFCLSLYCLVRATHAARPFAWATAGGFILGLAIASRPTYLLCSVLFTLPWFFRPRDTNGVRIYDWRTVVGAGIGCSAVVLTLLTYNYVRFGEPLEFGQKYQLTGIIESEGRHFSLTYWWVNIRLYFLTPLNWVTRFPFVSGVDLPPFPPGHLGHEYTFGMLPNLPFALLSLVSIAGVVRIRTSQGTMRLFWLSCAVIAGGAAINTMLMISYFGCCIRYMADFTPHIMLLAALGILVGETWIRKRRTRVVWLSATSLLAAFSSLVAAAGVVRYYESSPIWFPDAYRTIARTADASVLWVRAQRWRDFGPREIELTFPLERTPGQETLVAVRRGGRDVARLMVEYLEHRQMRLGYRETGDNRPTAYSAPFSSPPGARHKLKLRIGDGHSTARGPGGRIQAILDNVTIWDAPVVSFEAYLGELRIGADHPSADRARFSGKIHDVRSISLPSVPPLKYDGIRVRITLKPDMAGKAFPLVTTGRTRAADFLILEVHPDHQISFSYDHWGRPLLSSPKIPAVPGETRVIEFWVPALPPPGRPGTLLVTVDGAPIWERNVAVYPFADDKIFYGTNLIGGSNCDSLLVNAVFEDVQLPRPTK